MSNFSWIRTVKERHFIELQEAKVFCRHMANLGFNATIEEYTCGFKWQSYNKKTKEYQPSKKKDNRNKNKYTVTYSPY